MCGYSYTVVVNRIRVKLCVCVYLVYLVVVYSCARTVSSAYVDPFVLFVQGFRHMRTHMLAANGFCVVSIDSRGSDNRGVSFQAHLMNRMVSV